MTWIRFLFRRLVLETIPSLLVIVTLTFFLVRLAPGGPFSAEKSIPPEIQKRLSAYYGLDKSLPLQFLDYCRHLCTGDLGPSFKYSGRSVSELIAESLPVSAELGFWSLCIACVIGIGAGIVAALRHNTATDHAAMTFAMTGICLPTFVTGPLLILLFAVTLGWVAGSGVETPGDRVLPSLTLGLAYAAYIARLTRGGMLEVLVQDFIRTARAKGAPEPVVLFRHALRGGLMPALSFLGPALAGLITGSFVVETIFQVPGLGQFFVKSAFNRDYTMIMGTVLLYALCIIGFNTATDLLMALLDPRLKRDLT